MKKNIYLAIGMTIFFIIAQTVEVSAKAVLPEAGENTSPFIWGAAAIAIIAGLVLFFYKKKDNEK